MSSRTSGSVKTPAPRSRRRKKLPSMAASNISSSSGSDDENSHPNQSLSQRSRKNDDLIKDDIDWVSSKTAKRNESVSSSSRSKETAKQSVAMSGRKRNRVKKTFQQDDNYYDEVLMKNIKEKQRPTTHELKEELEEVARSNKTEEKEKLKTKVLPSTLNSLSLSFKTSLAKDNQFLQKNALKNTSIFIESKSLVQTIEHASTSYPNAPTNGLLLLEERKSEVINTARKCIKIAAATISQAKNDSDTTLYAVTLLKVAIHCIRSVSTLLTKSLQQGKLEKLNVKDQERIAVVVKLLYHIICTSDGLLQQNEVMRQSACISASKEFISCFSSHEWNELLMDSVLISINAYQILGRFLSLILPEDRYQIDASAVGMMCPIPCSRSTSRKERSIAQASFQIGDLNVEQLDKIASQSVQTISNIFHYLCQLSCLILIQRDIESDDDELISYFHAFLEQVFHIEQYHDDDKTTFTNFVECSTTFVLQVAMPWILAPLEEIGLEKEDEEIVKCTLSQVAKVAKSMIELVSWLEKLPWPSIGSECSNSINIVHEVSLYLQKKYVEVLLLRFRDTESKSCGISNHQILFAKIESIQKYFSKACLSAIRATSSYLKSRKSKQMAVTCFHLDIGKILDSLMYKTASIIPAYFEYVICRALHLSSNTEYLRNWKKSESGCSTSCVFTCFPFPFQHQIDSCNNGAVHISIVKVFFLSLAAKTSLIPIQKEVTDSIIDEFTKVIQSNEKNTRSIQLAYNTLSKLKLQSLAGEQVKLQDYSSYEKWLASYTIAKVLGDCYAPLNLNLMNQNMGEEARFLSLSIDSGLKACQLLEELYFHTSEKVNRVHDANQYCIPLSNKFMNFVKGLVLSETASMLKKFGNGVARSISNIAKRRTANNFTAESFHPFFLSLEIFVATGDENLPTRFHQVSSLLQSQKKIREAFVLLCYSISSVISLTDDDMSCSCYGDVLLFPEEFINGTLASDVYFERGMISEDLSQSIERLCQLFVSILADMKIEEENTDIVFPTPTLSVQMTSCTSLQIPQLLRYLIHSLRLFHVDHDEPNLELSQLTVLIYFLRSLSFILLKNEIFEGNESAALTLATCIRICLEEALELTQASSDSKCFTMLALVGVISASILNSLPSTCLREGHYTTRDCIQLAIDALGEMNDEILSPRNIIGQVALHSLCCEDDATLVQYLNDTLDAIAETKEVLRVFQEEKIFCNALLGIIFKRVRMFELASESYETLEYISLLKRMVNLHVYRNVDFVLFVRSFLTKGEVIQARFPKLTLNELESRLNSLQSLIEETSEVKNEETIDSLLIQIATLTALFEDSSIFVGIESQEVIEMSKLLLDYQERLNKSVISDQKGAKDAQILPMLFTRWSSSCSLAQYNAHLQIGNIARACYFLRQFYETKKNALRAIKGFKKIQLFREMIHGMSFIPFCFCFYNYEELLEQKMVLTLAAFANIFALAGDSRRAKQYALAVAEKMRLVESRDDAHLEPLKCIIKPRLDGAIIEQEITNHIHGVVSQCMPLSNYEIAVQSEIQFSSLKNIPLDMKPDQGRELLRYFTSIMMRIENLNRQNIHLLEERMALQLGRMSIIDTSIDFIESNEWTEMQKCIEALRGENFLKSSASICSAVLNLYKSLLYSKSEDRTVSSSHILETISSNIYATNECRAESFYLLALKYLSFGRSAGELQELWCNSVELDSSGFQHRFPNLCKARIFLSKGLSLLGPASSLLVRNMIRTLALTNGPEFMKMGPICTGELVHTSIGSTARQAASKNQNGTDELDKTLIELLRSFDIPFSEEVRRKKAMNEFYAVASKIIPLSWKFVAMTVCPTGEVLVSVACTHGVGSNHMRYDTRCVFPEIENEVQPETSFQDKFLSSFDHIMSESKRQLKGIDHDVATTKYNSSKVKKQEWWEKRYELDLDLCHLLDDFDEQYLSSLQLHEEVNDVDFVEENLASKFDAACTIENDNDISPSEKEEGKVEKDDLMKLTVVQLKERLQLHGCSSKELRPLRKARLVDLLYEKCLERVNVDSNEKTDTKHQDRKVQYFFLILDEQIQRLPLESTPTFRNKNVSRLPSLAFGITSMYRRYKSIGSIINPKNVSYVLDPEKNLKATQERVMSKLTSLTETNQWVWSGVVGKNPSKEFISEVLEQENGLYIYFGHGAGERFFSRVDIESFSQKGLKNWNCSSIILMGCSSGELKSVNDSKESHATAHETYFEPDGTLLSYLCIGSPCVVGNLWDVTDKDIDRFSLSLLDGLFNNLHSPSNVVEQVSSSRDACKLRFIVGAAPIVYGIPIEVMQSK